MPFVITLVSWTAVAVSVSTAVANVVLARRFSRSRAYRTGWVEGRQAMGIALVEALHRDLSLIEFLEAEAARDGYTVRIRREGNES